MVLRNILGLLLLSIIMWSVRTDSATGIPSPEKHRIVVHGVTADAQGTGIGADSAVLLDEAVQQAKLRGATIAVAAPQDVGAERPADATAVRAYLLRQGIAARQIQIDDTPSALYAK